MSDEEVWIVPADDGPYEIEIRPVTIVPPIVLGSCDAQDA